MLTMKFIPMSFFCFLSFLLSSSSCSSDKFHDGKEKLGRTKKRVRIERKNGRKDRADMDEDEDGDKDAVSKRKSNKVK